MTRKERFDEAVKILNEVNQKCVGEFYSYSLHKSFYRIFIKNGFIFESHLSRMKYFNIGISRNAIMIQF